MRITQGLRRGRALISSRDSELAAVAIIPLLIFCFVMFFIGSIANYIALSSASTTSKVTSYQCEGEHVKVDVRDRSIKIEDGREYRLKFDSIKTFNRFLNYCRELKNLKIEHVERVRNLFIPYNRVIAIDGFDYQSESNSKVSRKEQKLFRDTSVISIITFILLMNFGRFNFRQSSRSVVKLHGKSARLNSLLSVFLLPILVYFVALSSNELLFSIFLIVGCYLWIKSAMSVLHTTKISTYEDELRVDHVGPFGSSLVITKNHAYRIKGRKYWVRFTDRKLLSFISLEAQLRGGGRQVVGYTTDEKAADRVIALFESLRSPQSSKKEKIVKKPIKSSK